MADASSSFQLFEPDPEFIKLSVDEKIDKAVDYLTSDKTEKFLGHLRNASILRSDEEWLKLLAGKELTAEEGEAEIARLMTAVGKNSKTELVDYFKSSKLQLEYAVVGYYSYINFWGVSKQ